MTEYVTLIGTEHVRSAGHQMERAATEMQSAAGYIETALQRHAQRTDEALDRLEEILRHDREQRST